MRFVAGEVVELHNPRRSSAAQIGQWPRRRALKFQESPRSGRARSLLNVAAQ